MRYNGGKKMIEHYSKYEKSTGRIIGGGDSDNPLQYETEDVGVVVGVLYEFGYLESGVFFPMPASPSQNHTFNWKLKQWEDARSLQEVKDAKWEFIKLARSNAEYSGFTWDGSTFDSDATSQSRITGAVTLAMLNPSFSIDWVLADNSVRTLSNVDMVQVGMALGKHVATQFVKGAALRARIESAATISEVESVTW